MKQLIQSFKSGETILEEIPTPIPNSGEVLIKTSRSLVSLGTEKMLVEFGKANLFRKARQQPEKVKMVLNKIKSDGLIPTMETVFAKLEEPLPLGYCNVGTVIKIGKNVTEFKIGDRVASNGPHAEFVSISHNLIAHIPDNVSDGQASFTVIGSIGLQGIRLLNPTIGETIVVTGLGLIGLLTCQILMANGCKVIGLELDKEKIKIAQSLGIDAYSPTQIDLVKLILKETKGEGADGVIITASAKSNEIISQAAQMSRKRGRIILVGIIGLSLNRSEFYEKELTFQVSCSYGPGRYDENYETKGQDYPLPYVRWTVKRNFESILNLISRKQISVEPLISEEVKLAEFNQIYSKIGKSGNIASILIYEDNIRPNSTVKTSSVISIASNGKLAIIGAGNFTKMTMLPNLKQTPIKYIVSRGGLSAKTLASKYKIEFSTTDYEMVLTDPEVSLVIITTRHNLHAEMVIAAIQAGKNVFVEKPLALYQYELNSIIQSYQENNSSITVGFNRRFSPHTEKIKSITPESAHKNMIATMNAGHIPLNIWVHDINIGGGRIIGEACHFIDLLVHISGSLVKSVCMNSLGLNSPENTDNASILLKFENGDTGVVNYFSNGNKSYSKERLEIYFDEKTIIMDNFRETKGYGIKGFSKLKTKLDKGHKKQFEKLITVSKTGGRPLIPFDQLINVTKASFAALESMKTGGWILLQN